MDTGKALPFHYDKDEKMNYGPPQIVCAAAEASGANPLAHGGVP